MDILELDHSIRELIKIHFPEYELEGDGSHYMLHNGLDIYLDYIDTKEDAISVLFDVSENARPHEDFLMDHMLMQLKINTLKHKFLTVEEQSYEDNTYVSLKINTKLLKQNSLEELFKLLKKLSKMKSLPMARKLKLFNALAPLKVK